MLIDSDTTSLGTHLRLGGNLFGISWDRCWLDTCTSLDPTPPPPWCADTSSGGRCESARCVDSVWWRCGGCWGWSVCPRAPTRPAGNRKLNLQLGITFRWNYVLILNPKRDLYRTQSVLFLRRLSFRAIFPRQKQQKIGKSDHVGNFSCSKVREKESKNWSRNDIKMSSRMRARERKEMKTNKENFKRMPRANPIKPSTERKGENFRFELKGWEAYKLS